MPDVRLCSTEPHASHGCYVHIYIAQVLNFEPNTAVNIMEAKLICRQPYEKHPSSAIQEGLQETCSSPGVQADVSTSMAAE